VVFNEKLFDKQKVVGKTNGDILQAPFTLGVTSSLVVMENHFTNFAVLLLLLLSK
jgi:hypothetical protein